MLSIASNTVICFHLLKLNIESNDVVYDYIRRRKDMTNSKLINMYKAYDE